MDQRHRDQLASVPEPNGDTAFSLSSAHYSVKRELANKTVLVTGDGRNVGMRSSLEPEADFAQCLQVALATSAAWLLSIC